MNTYALNKSASKNYRIKQNQKGAFSLSFRNNHWRKTVYSHQTNMR